MYTICLNVKNNFCTQHVLPMFWARNFHVFSMKNLSSYCGLVDAKIRASDKDLPAPVILRDLLKTILILLQGTPLNYGYTKQPIRQNSVTNRMTTTANMGLFLLIIISRSRYLLHSTHHIFQCYTKLVFSF